MPLGPLEGNTAIDHEPAPGMAEQIEIHADLATPPQGHKPMISGTGGHDGGFCLPGVANPEFIDLIKVFRAFSRATIVVEG